MRQINFWVVNHIAGKVPNLDATSDRPLHGGGLCYAELIGADDAHRGQVQSARVPVKQLPFPDLQIAYGQRERLCVIDACARCKMDLAREPGIWIGSFNETKTDMCEVCI